MMKAFVVLSGGPDSTAAALWARSQGWDVHALTFQFYGNVQNPEMRAAMNVAHALAVPHTFLDVKTLVGEYGLNPHILMHGGQRKAERKKQKVVRMPYGAGLVLTVTASYALAKNAGAIVWGATRDDAKSRSEYSQDFATRLADLINSVEGTSLQILAPMSALHKFEILRAFEGRPELFALTWSCTTFGFSQCGKCHACVARRLAAAIAKLQDQTIYLNPDYPLPFTKEQHEKPETVSDDDWAHVLDSPDSPKELEFRIGTEKK